MNKCFAVIFLAAVPFLTGCRTASPDAGHASVLVQHPLLFGHGGVDPDPVTTGTSWIALTTDAVDVDLQPHQYELKLNDLMSLDGVPLDFDAVVRLRVKDPVDLIKRFGPNWYENNVEREFSNLMRYAVKKHTMNDTAISTVATTEIDQEVGAALQTYIQKIGLPVEMIDVTAGKANPPDAIKSQRIETAQQEQRIITEGQMKLAEDARKAAEQSRAEADNAYRNALGLSPEQFIQLQAIEMERQACLHNHCTFIIGKSDPVVSAR